MAVGRPRRIAIRLGERPAMSTQLALRALVLLQLMGGPIWAHPDTVMGGREASDHTLPAQPTPAPREQPAAFRNDPVTVYPAKKILTMDPMQPEATAIAVQGNRILAVGSQPEVTARAGQAPVTVDSRFANSILLPGFIEAHMHAQITGILWQGVYVGRFDRYTPDGHFEPGLRTKKEVVDKLAQAAKKAGDSWVVGWGYQPEFYHNEPLTIEDLDPISGAHPMLIENASMHIYYVNSPALKRGGFSPSDNIPGLMVKKGKLTGEFQELAAVMKLLPQLPKMDAKLLLQSTWNAAKLAHQVGVTSISDASFGTIPGGYQAYQSAAADPNFPVRVTLYPLIDVIKSPDIQARGGLNYLKSLMASNTNRLSLGAVKMIVDGSVQGQTAWLNWPYYLQTGKNGVANMTYPQLEKAVEEVHRAGLQCMIHTNGDQATDWGIRAVRHAQDIQPRFDHRHRFEHTQMVTDYQLQQMAKLGIAVNLFINHVHFWGDLHRDEFLGAARAAQMNPLHSAVRNGVHTSVHTDASVTRLDPLFEVWVAATRKTMSGAVLGPAERISVADGLRMVTVEAAYLMHQDDVKGTLTPGKLADIVALSENPLEVPLDHVKDIRVLATVMDGKVFPLPDYKKK
jgi:predicted amidohydrolase YtcJ